MEVFNTSNFLSIVSEVEFLVLQYEIHIVDFIVRTRKNAYFIDQRRKKKVILRIGHRKIGNTVDRLRKNPTFGRSGAKKVANFIDSELKSR